MPYRFNSPKEMLLLWDKTHREFDSAVANGESLSGSLILGESSP